MKKRWFVLSLLLLTVVNLAGFSTLAYRRWCAHCEKKACCSASGGEALLQERLELSASQAAGMHALRAEFDAIANEHATAMEQARIDLTRELMNTEPDSAAISGILQRICDNQAELQRHSVNHLLAQKALLSSEQQHKLFSLVLHSCAMNATECINHKANP